MYTRINFLVDDFGASQISYYITRNANRREDICAVVFYQNMSSLCIQPNFPIMSVAEAWQAPGPMIATSLSTADRLLTFPIKDKKFLYIWDMVWTRGQKRLPYEVVARIIQHPDLKIIARSEHHAKVIENDFNIKPVSIVEDADLEKILCLI